MRKENLEKFFSAMPVPRATARRGSSAMWTCSLVLEAYLKSCYPVGMNWLS